MPWPYKDSNTNTVLTAITVSVSSAILSQQGQQHSSAAVTSSTSPSKTSTTTSVIPAAVSADLVHRAGLCTKHTYYILNVLRST